MVEGYSAEEVIEFYTDYLERVDPIGILISRHEQRLQGAGTTGHKFENVSYEMRNMAHLKILQNLTLVGTYVNDHIAELKE